MAKTIQIRNVPDDLHRKLKARAATAGMSLSDYLLQEIRKSAERPTVEELMERLKRLTPVEVSAELLLRSALGERVRRVSSMRVRICMHLTSSTSKSYMYIQPDP